MPKINIISNGSAKSIDYSQFGGLDGYLATVNSGSAMVDETRLRKVVPWLNKGVQMTANAVSQMPYTIEDGEKELDLDKTWGSVRNPQTLMYLTAAALCGGKAYWKIDATSRAIISAQYLLPSTVTPNYDSNGVLKDFTRKVNSGGKIKKETLSLEEVVYFWLPDDTVENGPAQITPMSNALMAAGLIAQMDGSIYTQSESGFVPPVIISMKGLPSLPEAQKMESKIGAWLRGLTKNPAKIIDSESTSIVPLGANVADFKGIYTEIKKSATEDIASAYGIPAAIFMSDMAFATEVNPLFRIWYLSSVVTSIYQTIEDSLTDQLWDRFGYKMEYQLNRMEAFQQDEVDSSGAVVSLAGSIETQPQASLIAMSILGYELTDEQIAEIEGMKKESAIPEPVKPNPSLPEPIQEPVKAMLPVPTPEENAIAEEVIKWRAFCERPRKRPFETKHIPAALALQINAKLKTAKNQDEINSIFDSVVIPRQVVQDASELKTLADAINSAAASMTFTELQKVSEQPMQIIIDTKGNVIETQDNNSQKILEAIKALVEMNAAKPEPAPIFIPAPLVTVQAAQPAVNNITVQPAQVSQPVNNITVTPAPTPENIINVQPAPVILPALPTTAEITTDKSGKRTMKIIK